MRLPRLIVIAACASLVTACGGGGGMPNGSVVNFPGGPTDPPTKLVNVKVTVTIPPSKQTRNIRPDYISINTESLVIQLASVDGEAVSGVNPTTINTTAHSGGCKTEPAGTVCTATASGSPGDDQFAVTTYAGTNATGSVLSFGTVDAKISGGGSGVTISNQLSLSLASVIAAMKLTLSPDNGKRGKPVKSSVTLVAYDATGAQIVGPSDFSTPITLAIQGDDSKAFTLHAGGKSGASLTIVKPTSGISLTYDGNSQASSITVAATVDGPGSNGVSQNFKLTGKQPPPPVGTIYALNLGTNNGQGATVTEYGGSAKGNAAPERTLALSSKLFARSIAVDSSGNLYVGYFDNQYGFSPATGLPDKGNQIAVYPAGASGNAQPSYVLTDDPATKTALFPLFITFDPSGDLVIYGATNVDGNDGSDAVLTYPPGSKDAAAPSKAWAFSSPSIYYAGPTGLALDSSGNFYVNGELHTSLGPQPGLYVALASDNGNPSVNPSRTIPWNSTTELTPGLTTNVSINGSGEVYITNSLEEVNKSSYPSCQGRVNVFSAGTGGGTTDSKPLRVLTLDTVYTANPVCVSPNNVVAQFFPSATLYGTTLFVADDFNNVIDAFSGNGNNTVQPILQISGSATGLNAPIALVITSDSEQAKARSAPSRWTH
jgi:hypothetical protein